jgi:hypothetical protein
VYTFLRPDGIRGKCAMRILRPGLAALLALASLGFSTGTVAAYGRADQPLAQIELSGNCDNPGFSLCAPPPAGFGLGGIWVWIEVDADQTADVAGVVCIRGAKSLSLRGTFPAWWSATPEGDLVVPVPGPPDPNGYYNVDFGQLGGVNSFQASLGHYSLHPLPGVALELQVAP